MGKVVSLLELLRTIIKSDDKLNLNFDSHYMRVIKFRPPLGVEQLFFFLKKVVLLEHIQKFLGVRNVFKDRSKKIIHYRISSVQDLAGLLGHLDRYPLITQKLADYQLFKQGYNLVVNKQHLTLSGLQKIVALKASMNLGLSDLLKRAFPYVTPEVRPIVVDKAIPDPQ